MKTSNKSEDCLTIKKDIILAMIFPSREKRTEGTFANLSFMQGICQPAGESESEFDDGPA